jgi:tryptophanyl-tRNA synthetase
VADQERHDAIYCVVDLHAMTLPYSPDELAGRTRQTALLLMAAGIDPTRCILFVQSHVLAHAELTWLLNCVTTFGELRRMTQFKEKSEGQESVSVGLFDYPVLMVADIVLYDTDEVPIGDDQRQHLELARDVAIRFNSRFGVTFVVPAATFPPVGGRVMDSGTDIRHDPANKPGISNLLEIHAAVTGGDIPEIEDEFAGSGYGAFKSAVADAVVEALRPLQEAYAKLEADPAEVDRQLALGAEKARAIADPVLVRARAAVGLLASR